MFNHYFQHVYELKADLEELGCEVEVSEFTKDGHDWLTVEIIYPAGVVPPPLPIDEPRSLPPKRWIEFEVSDGL